MKDNEYEKIIEHDFFGNVTYILTVRSTIEGLEVEAENKYTGDLWLGSFEPQYIEQLTTKVGNVKKYGVYSKMLLNGLNFNSDSITIDILTHHDLGKQKPKNSKINDERNNSVYLIMSYIAEFDKVHYPLPLNYVSQPDPDRLKLAIRRLSSELKSSQTNLDDDELIKEIKELKYENEILKSKIKPNRNESKENLTSNLMNKQIQEENRSLLEEIAMLKNQKEEEANRKDAIIEEKDRQIKELSERVRKQEENSDEYEQYEEKFNLLSKEANEIVSALQHSRENEKKSQIKIANLEKELSKMMAQLKNKPIRTPTYTLNSPRKSDNGSIKSTSSVSKKPNTTKNNIARNISKNSVHDSDTESSKIKKSGRESPYRNPNRPLNSSKSKHKKEPERVNTKFSNISNLYNKDRNRNRSRSRSQSQSQTRSIKRQDTPPDDEFESSAQLTDRLDFASDEDNESKVSSTIARLRENRSKRLNGEQTKANPKKNSMGMGPIEEKISSIASLMRNFSKNRENNN